jgi:DNA-binding GntR family transcriptional regulator
MALPLAPLPETDDRHSFSEHIANSLRNAIRSGEFADGFELNQIELAEHFGVSRVPVREAMRQLQAEGWIDAKRHQRAVVRGLNGALVLETLELRAWIEAYLIEKTIGTIRDHELDRLDELCAQMEASRYHEHWLRLNHLFHTDLYASTGSAMTRTLVDRLSSQVERYVHLVGEPITRETEANAEHRAILAAMRQRDVAESQRLIRLHIGHTIERVRDAYTQQPQPPAKG